MFSHLVIFYTNPNEPNAAEELIAAANQYLKPIPGIQFFHVGKMAPTDRSIVIKNYQVALNTVFADKQAHDEYQAHPRQREFIQKAYRRLCQKAAVFDFE
jgi:hypothetical protein